MIRLLLGGSPCTHWSIAQTKDRETEPSGIGWELFLNYRIARDKYKPDFFLYENNKSMSPAIRAQITKELGVEPVLINSALVSAQSRQRLYWVGRRNEDGTYSQVDVSQPEDRSILLRDILESGNPFGTTKEKSYTLVATYHKGQTANRVLEKSQRTMVAEPVCVAQRGRYDNDGKIYQNFEARPDGKTSTLTTVQKDNMVAEPARIGTIESAAKNADFDSQQYRVYSPDGKSVTLCGNGGGVGAKTGLYAEPVRVANINGGGQGNRIYSTDAKSCAIKAQGGGLGGHGQGLYAVPVSGAVRIGTMPDGKGRITTSQNNRIYSTDGKSVTLLARANGGGADGSTTGLYAVLMDGGFVATNSIAPKGKTYHIYQVKDGLITIKDKQYPIKLTDGHYIIRKLTVLECMRLQTVPEWYKFTVSDTQAYKMLGNGWTVDVIAHIMSHFEGITTEPVEALGMYDGMSCGHIALDKLGVNVVRYYATEIDKYAIKTTMENYPTTVQLGDAFGVRDDDWSVTA